MNFTQHPNWSVTALLLLFTTSLSAQPPCDAVNSRISTDDFLFAIGAGSDAANLNLGYQTGPVVTFPISDQVESTSPKTTKIYRSDGGTPESCVTADRGGANDDTRYDVYRLIPDQSGKVTFRKEAESQSTLQFTIFKDYFAPNDGCGPNWVASSFTTTNGGFNRLELTVDLALGTTYYLMVTPIASGPISYPLPYTVNVSSSSGALPTLYAGEDFAVNYDYIYLAATASDNTIKEVSKTGDFRSLPVGEYNIFGVNYDTINIQEESFIEETTTSIKTNNGTATCLQLSSNSLALDIVDSGSVAPVVWLSFRGEAQATSVKLAWEVASETENDYFRVERSVDGKDWTDLGEVAGNGTTQAYAAFEYIDVSPLSGTSLYRLAQVDFDGTEHLSTVVQVDWQGPTEKLSTFPNPFSDQLTVEMPTDVLSTPRLFDLQGREVTQSVEIRELSDNRAVLATAALPRGLYVVRWGGEELRIVKN